MTVEELRCFEAAYKDVYERHTRAMDRIRCEHERLLRDVKLPDVKSSAQYSSQLRELQKQWLETHPKPSLVMPSLEPLPGNAKLDEAALLPFDEDQQERVAAAVAAARTEASLDCERQLREEEESLASDVRSSVEAYRTKHLLEVRSKLVQRRKLLNDLEANISKGPGAQIAISEYGTDAVQTCSTQRDNIVSLEEVGKREEELRQRLQAQIDILQESKQRAQAQLRQKQLLQVQQQQVPPSFLTAGRLPPTVPIQTTASVRQEQLFTPRTSRQQKQPHEHNSLSTPLLNNTWSSIHSPHTGSSSARQTPLKVTAFLNPPLSSLEKQTAPPPEAGVVCPLRDERIEDQLRRVRAKLSEKRDELRAGQLRMERSRLMWLKDMESCRVRGDREAASMLLQVKKSLEEKARYLNREVLNLRQAFAHLRESELRYRREMMGARVASPGANNNSHADPHNITMSTSVAANGSKRLIELLEGMLVRAEQLERSVSRPKSKSREHRTTLMRGENKAGNLWAPSPRFRERRRDVGAGEKSSGRFFSDLTRWLEEQQPPG
ncbi:hypothetical protein, conserved [Trypanosoma vivax Y486]|uniref:Uncharacterized protein n=1 Tax=Trypanosoma vivax (strain Y486) TaxID=1055687 RepID=F9WKE3_TRYVY|nr:hypothetical protein, conserved [Trypanosoma vivax Y486]|eukprot:CCD17963.1 hypothetical protein, conserved [Trypanosoma vivax Y486]